MKSLLFTILAIILVGAFRCDAAQFSLYELADFTTYRLDLDSEIPLYGYDASFTVRPLAENLSIPFADPNGGDFGATTEPLSLVSPGYYHLADLEIPDVPIGTVITVTGTIVDSNFDDVAVTPSSVIPSPIPEPSPFWLLSPWVLLLRRAA